MAQRANENRNFILKTWQRRNRKRAFDRAAKQAMINRINPVVSSENSAPSKTELIRKFT